MMRRGAAFIFLCILAIPVAGQQQQPEGKITYISGDAIYTSLGRNAGVHDSSRVYVMNQNDTAGVLIVIAASSSSSACRSLSPGKRFKINDRVIAFIEASGDRSAIPPPGISLADSVRRDSLSVTSIPGTLDLQHQASSGGLSLHGSIGIQYFGSVYSTVGQNNAQPALSVNVRGTSTNSPFSFQLRGMLRTNVTGTLNPFARSNTNRSRLHRMSLDYDDGLYKFSIGRVPPSPFPGLGYVDGFFGSFRKGMISGGFAAGFEPGYGQAVFSSERRKAALFFGISSADRTSYGLTLGYSRSYIFANLDRESAGAIFSSQPTPELWVYAQSEIDLRTTTDHEITFSPRFTSLYGNVAYRPFRELSVGAGITSFRPLYSLQTALALADSLVDRELRTNPYISASIYLPERIMVFGQYGPRSSPKGFGKEFLVNAGVSASDFVRSGLSVRTTLFRNASGLNRTDGLTLSLQKSIMSVADVTGRFQLTRTAQDALSDPLTSRTFGLDLSLALTDHFSLWGSLERTMDSHVSSTLFLTELSWRF
jgi:hypothetical protein